MGASGLQVSANARSLNVTDDGGDNAIGLKLVQAAASVDAAATVTAAATA